MRFPSFKNELTCLRKGFLPVGCDEVGRGPLAGPVVAAACILDYNSIGGERTEDKWYARVRDSKTVLEKEREILVKEILAHSLAYGIGEVWQEEIDKINIHNATLLAMKRAVAELQKKIKSPGKMFLLVDGRFTIPDLEIKQESITDGDADVLSIAAASIIAKVHRDKIMHKLDREYPNYGFKNHKGYGTKEHMRALLKFGISLVHRKTFVKI